MVACHPDRLGDRLADTLRLAETLGGEAITIPGVGRRIADDLIQFAQANNVTQIIIGRDVEVPGVTEEPGEIRGEQPDQSLASKFVAALRCVE